VGEPTVLTKLPTVLNALYDAEILEEGKYYTAIYIERIIILFLNNFFFNSDRKLNAKINLSLCTDESNAIFFAFCRNSSQVERPS
jgi:hypothetical protein